ncbi:hypothetical protein JJB07_00735 [Tumebacillus sp. ITR2]|uniref:Deoxynucleoside kinase domain-containing protein n=1 Tax=Tumebacillus amylolyticus TaxID=2801339 RepID=A0ABS1J4F6_9BACL|nr:hypothetical protein [Tumebacillus amylolyticus]MBL0385157.1 hypothetical protein [Tumebacillus amylolyticus]
MEIVPQTKLVLVEGIMGSGKTSTAQFAADVLVKNGRATELFLEGNLDHPADYDRVACLNEATYQEFVNHHPESEAEIAPFLTRTGDDILISYGKIGTALALPQFEELAKYDIYDGISLSKHRELLLARWSEFAAQQAKRESTVIFDCAFLQNPMCAFLAKHNAGREAVVEHIRNLAELIQPLNPLLIYFYQTNIRESVERVCEVRSKEWLDFVISYHTEQGYGLEHGLHGFDGLIEFLQMRQDLELALLPQLPLNTLVLENSNHDWDTLLPQIEEKLIKG